MAEEKGLVVYAGAYETAEAALADLDAIEQLHKDELIGQYDAAVIDQKNGKPHVVKRMDRPHIGVIPEWFGGGTLPRKELHEAAEELSANQAGLIAVGEPAIEKGLDEAFTGAAKVVKRAVNTTTGEITSELQEALKEANMSITESPSTHASSDASAGKVHDLEVHIIPVSDVDRSKQFYQRLGWRFDDDVAPLDGLRIVQFTPPGSGASVTFGTGLTAAAPGSALAGLIVSDIEAAHDELAGRGSTRVRCGTARRSRRRHGNPVPTLSARVTGLLLLQRSRRQYVAGPGGHDAAARPNLIWHSHPRRTWRGARRVEIGRQVCGWGGGGVFGGGV